MDKLNEIIGRIPDLSNEAMDRARARQDRLTKPKGSLGVLEDLSILIAGITGCERPKIKNKVVFVFAGDHGVTDEGVSAYPREVTAQMVYNFLRGGAAINVLARHAGARVVVVDAGVAEDLEKSAGLVSKKVGHGTKNMAIEPAMTENQAMESLLAGISSVEDELQKGMDMIAVGEMGIGNTTSSAAIASAVTGLPPESLTGKGTGIDDLGQKHKTNVIKKALALHRPDKTSGIDILRKVGGFEIGAIAGAILAASSHRIPVVIDGFISTAGALIANLLCPKSARFMVASHLSSEIGHRAMLAHLGVSPLFDFGLRLGEGSGAALAIGIVEAACKLLDEMATFGEAGVSEKE
jgi:nicotinate-nucleotide--dimethylbenzimidazole phosphoribosyltransferase